MNYDHRPTRLCQFNQKCNNAYDCEGVPMKLHHCFKCDVIRPKSLSEYDRGPYVPKPTCPVPLKGTGCKHADQIALVSKFQELVRKTTTDRFAVARLVFSKQLIRDAKAALRKFCSAGCTCNLSSVPTTDLQPSIDLTVPPFGELTVKCESCVIIIRPTAIPELFLPVDDVSPVPSAPVSEEDEKKSDNDGQYYVGDTWEPNDYDGFLEGWGDEPVPVFQSEVLGSSANEWINSDDMLIGGVRGRKSKRGNGRGRGRRKGRRGGGAPKVMVNRSHFWAPDRIRTHLVMDLRFTSPAATLLAPWSLNYIILTNPNSFTGASTSVPGYASLAAMYRKYRVRTGRLVYRCQNNEGFGIEIFACPVNFLPSLTADPSRYLSMQNARRYLMSPKGGMDHGTVRVSASIAQFGGSANTTVEDNYVGTTDNTSPPSDNLYIIYGFLTNGAASVNYNLDVITVSVEIDFFELQSPAT